MNIGILASGGDGAGMNYCLYQLYKNLHKKNKVVLFNAGYKGLINNSILNYNYKFICNHKLDGGIIIKSSRCAEFETQEGISKALDTIKTNKLDLIIVLGGNGSFMGVKALNNKGVNVMFIPCSIDNDIVASDYSIGFDTACKSCIDYINQVNDTMKSFNRTCIYEVMGRDCDKIANIVAQKVGASYLYNDDQDTKEDCKNAIQNALTKTNYPIIVLRENLTDINKLKQYLIEELKIDVKHCVIGYYQRGGKPTKKEVFYANILANECVNQIKQDNLNKQIVVKNNFAKAINI